MASAWLNRWENKVTYAMFIIVVVIIKDDIIVPVRHFYCPISWPWPFSLFWALFFYFALFSQNDSDLNLIGQNTNVRLAPSKTWLIFLITMLRKLIADNRNFRTFYWSHCIIIKLYESLKHCLSFTSLKYFYTIVSFRNPIYNKENLKFITIVSKISLLLS